MDSHTSQPMSIHVALHHVTSYLYDRLVTLSPQLVRLRPAPHCRTPILSYSQRITPAAHFINWQQDPQSNYVARLTFPERVQEFRVEVDVVAGAGAGQRGRELLGLDRRLPLRNPRPGCRGPAFGSDSG